MAELSNYLALFAVTVVIVLLIGLPIWATVILLLAFAWLLIDVGRKLAK